MFHLKHHHTEDEFIAEKGRVEAYSDAVIAIITTLLILELRVPELHGHGLREQLNNLLPLWPKFAAFAFSFFTLAVIWVNHHHFFHGLKGIDKHLLWYNNNLLFWICLVPFATALAGEHLGSPVPTFLFGLAMFIMAFSFMLMLRYAFFKAGLVPETVSARAKKLQFKRSLYGPIVYALAALLALFHPWVSIALYLSVMLFYFLPQRFANTVVDMGNSDT